MPLDLSYPNIVKHFGPHNVPGRTESAAFVSWFLEHYYRLEVNEAQDAICDGFDDKGVDGLYVDDNLERITLFQSKLLQNPKKTIGDTVLKEFAGTLSQFKTKKSVEHLIATTTNAELRELLKERNVAELVGSGGYKVLGIFVSNAEADANAKNFLKTNPEITVYDGKELQAEWLAPGDSVPIKGKVGFSLDGLQVIEYKTTEATAFVAPLLASELIQLDGIQSTALFDWNVRKSLGRTKVNKAIAESIAEQKEHRNFVLFHNGLTILAESVTRTKDKLTVDKYTVVNGCQSLTTLFENKAQLSDELRVITRIVKLSADSPLAAKITRHSNNQNSISARDLQSNSTIQKRLKSEFAKAFGKDIGYEIKRGEDVKSPIVINNEEAARTLLAFDVQQPWACHQPYRLFDELHGEIFGRPEVTAERIVTIDVMRVAVIDSLAGMKNKLVANYRLTRYFMLYLLRHAISLDQEGKDFIVNPAPLFKKLGPKKLLAIFSAVLSDLVIDFNAELDDREADKNPFDHKRELKSPTMVKKLLSDILANYQKGVKRNKSALFSTEVAAALATPKKK